MSIDKLQFEPEVLISIHIPKTGGTTLREVLIERFSSNLYLDYGYDTNIENPTSNIKAIHTHNPYSAYENILVKPRILTILRDPLARAISHYYYWLHLPDSEDPEEHGEIYIKFFIDNKPDLESFLLSDNGWLTNIYTEQFLTHLSTPDDFWFVGFLETFNEDIVDLQKLLGLKPKTMPVLNKSKKPAETVSEQIKTEFYRRNKRDKDFYDMMFAERNLRKDTIGSWTKELAEGDSKQTFLNSIKNISRRTKSLFSM